MSDDDQFRLPDNCNACIRELSDYWLRLKSGAAPGARLPDRRDFDPLGLSAACWSGLWLLTVVRDPIRFRVRLAGTDIVRFFGSDLTGQWVDAAFPDFENSDEFKQFHQCISGAAPVFNTIKASSATLDWRHAKQEWRDEALAVEQICLPFSADGDAVDALLLMTQVSRRQVS